MARIPPLDEGQLDEQQRELLAGVRVDGAPASNIFATLVRHPGHVKTRRQLTREGYPHDNYVSERTIDSHVKRIRKKFEAVDGQFDRIDTVYGMGYRWTG